MRKDKTLLIIIALILILLSVASCTGNVYDGSRGARQGNPPDNSQTSIVPSALPVTLKWALWDWDAIVYYHPLIEAFTQNNPHITIEFTDLGAADYHTVLSIQLAYGGDFDLITIKDIPGYSDLVRHGRLEPLSEFALTQGIDIEAFGGLVEEITVDGEFYALPFRSDFWVMFYNKRLFDQAGVEYPNNYMTLEDFDRIARAMTSGEGSDKIYGAHYHSWRSTTQLFGILDGQNNIVEGSYDFLRPTYEMVLAQQSDDVVMDFTTLRTTAAHYSGLWQNGRIAMMNMGTWYIPTAIMRIENGESLADHWGIVRYPVPAGTEFGTTLGTITSIAVSAASPNKTAALDFSKFISGPDGAAILAGLGQFPAIMDDNVVNLITSMPGFPPDPQSREALISTKIYLEMPLHERSGDIEAVLNEVHNEILSYAITIDEGITEMNERVQAILREN